MVQAQSKQSLTRSRRTLGLMKKRSFGEKCVTFNLKSAT
jgi:hypothetical protein